MVQQSANTPKKAAAKQFLSQLKKGRVLLFAAITLVCLFFSWIVWTMPMHMKHEFGTVDLYNMGDYEYAETGTDAFCLAPGQWIEQEFTATANLVGECGGIHFGIFLEELGSNPVSLTLKSKDTDTEMTVTVEDISQNIYDDWTVLDFPHVVMLRSGEHFTLRLTNLSETEDLYLRGTNATHRTMTQDGESINGILNTRFMRKSTYQPSSILKYLIVVTVLTVLIASALVLFGNVKVHILYLVLALSFGFVMLFDLTPMYGFDMRFQFDSTYVLSNQLLGMEGAIWEPSFNDPEVYTVSYYRRACDDYSQFQFYGHMSVFDNYRDVSNSVHNLMASEEDRQLVLTESNLGFLGDQLYLHLPQALAFAIARLLGLGLFPMLQLARFFMYLLFAALMLWSIRSVPFGKRIFLILALTPTVMVQTLSLSRDAMIIAMGFFLTAKVLQVAYAEKMPSKWDWAVIAIVSVLLAPCKMVYLPVSFYWLLILYRKYLKGRTIDWKKALIRMGLLAIPVVILFCIALLPKIIAMLSVTEKADLYGTTSYSLQQILLDPANTLLVFGNTFRNSIGAYFVNAVQLFDIGLGSSDGITLLIFLLLTIEICRSEDARAPLGGAERGYSFLVFLGVFLLVSVAAMQWTPNTSLVLEGLQGRYLTPALPLVCFAMMNNKLIRIHSESTLFVDMTCCLFPAITLMNMFLWTIGQ